MAHNKLPHIPVDARCKVTGNLLGTDTWAVGYICPCDECQKVDWNAVHARMRADALLFSGACATLQRIAGVRLSFQAKSPWETPASTIRASETFKH